MGDATDFGRRPFVIPDPSPASGEALKACPGAGLQHTFDRHDSQLVAELTDAWGPVRQVWEGCAADEAIRFAGSSGGAATALALYCVEQEAMAGVLHTAARPGQVVLNETVYSRTRAEMLSRTGSRYAPASPCDKLDQIEQADAPSVFIGKPCDVAGLQQARRLRPLLDAKVGLTIAFFCAGTPSTRGTLRLLQQMGVQQPMRLKSLRYRGNGWPGMFTAQWVEHDGTQKTAEMSYAESWGFLQKYRQWRCYICPDHTGEFADIAVGDPWYRDVAPGEAGKSLIIGRTPLGCQIIEAAQQAGYLTLESNDTSLLPRSQPNLLQTRAALWGRLWALRAAGAAVPNFVGFPMFAFWRRLPLHDKLSSFTGTLKRVLRRKLYKSIAIEQNHGESGDVSSQ